MGAGLGFDAREFLPPHFPIGRNEDGAFGVGLRACRPFDPTLFLPLAVLHDPEPRPSADDAITKIPSERRFNDLLGDLAGSWSSPIRDADGRAQALGAFLVGWGQSSAGTFEELIRMQTWRR